MRIKRKSVSSFQLKVEAVTEKGYELMRGALNASIFEVQNLMSIMQTSKGRDKIFGLIQYIVDLYVKCRQHAGETPYF